MEKSLQVCAVLALLAVAVPASAAMNREIPLHVQTFFTKGTPVTVGQEPRGLAFDGSQIWVANYDSSTITRIDAVTNKVLQTITLAANSYPASIVFDGTYVWVFGTKGYKYDKTGASKLGTPLTLSGSAWGAAFDGTSIWVSTTGGLDKVNISSNTKTTYALACTNGAVAYDGASVWVSNIDLGICKFDPTTNTQVFSSTSILTGNSMNHLAFDGQFLWICADQNAVIQKLDVSTNEVVATVSTYPDPRSGAFDGSYLWVVGHDSDTIQRVDVRTNQIVDTIPVPVGTAPYNIVFDGTHMWVGTQGTNPATVRKILVRFN
jgi:YVTN family beta-propeller protein